MVQSPDPVEDALGDATAAWRADRDARALRRRLLALLAAMEVE